MFRRPGTHIENASAPLRTALIDQVGRKMSRCCAPVQFTAYWLFAVRESSEYLRLEVSFSETEPEPLKELEMLSSTWMRKSRPVSEVGVCFVEV